MHTQQHTQTRTEYAIRFYVVDQRNRKTYMPIAYCDRYATHQEAYAWGQHMRGLYDGFVIETVPSTVTHS